MLVVFAYGLVDFICDFGYGLADFEMRVEFWSV